MFGKKKYGSRRYNIFLGSCHCVRVQGRLGCHLCTLPSLFDEGLSEGHVVLHAPLAPLPPRILVGSAHHNRPERLL